MPVITVAMAKVENQKKKELIQRLTSAAVEVTGLPESAFTVFIQELDYHNIGIGGKALAQD